MATLKQLIEKYEKEWNKYGMGSTISYSRLVTELKKCVDETSNENSALPIPDVSNNEVAVCDCKGGKFVFNEVTQQLICGCGRRITVTN